MWRLFLISLLALTACQPSPQIDRPAMAEKVKQEFLHAWNGYKTYAWGHDDLKPLSQSYHDWHETPLLMTPVDGFSTMKLMGLEDQAADAKALIMDQLRFDIDLNVQVFEIIIRQLGGLLSAYQLDDDARFLALAKDLGDRLLPAFDSPTAMPYRYVDLVTGETADPVSNPAEIGTTILEFGTLSKETGDPRYYDAAMKALKALFERRSAIDLVGTQINVETGEWVDPATHIGGMIDSYYEYLYKGWLMFGDETLKQMWDVHIVALNSHLADEVDSGFWYGRGDMNQGEVIRPVYGALDAFFAGTLALSGDLDRAAKLQASNFKMWMLHGIEPEGLNYVTMESTSNGYVLRPENIESAYYLYKLTGEDKYLDMGRQMFESLVQYCRNETGYAHLKDVRTKEQTDAMQSFFLAETLKYSYLLFAPIETIDFNKTVFNTEAHPLKVWK